MKYLRLLSIRSILARPLRAILSTFGIVLGVAAIIAIGVTNQSALDAVVRLFETTSGRADLIITNRQGDEAGFSDGLVDQLRKIPAIRLAAPSLQVQTVLAKKTQPGGIDLSFFGTDLGGLLLYGIDPLSDQQVREYSLAAGRFLSPDNQADEIVLVRTYAEENEIELGRFVEFLAAGKVEKLRVVGLIERDGAGQLNNGAFGVLPLGVAQKIFDRPDTIDQVDLLLTPGLSSVELEAERLRIQALLGEDYSVIYPASQGRRMTQMLSNYQIGLNFLSAMALFVGAFLIYNAFSMTVVERTREFGMLRTMGMTQRQVISQVLFEALVMGCAGSALGVGLGFVMAGGLSRLMSVMMAQEMVISDAPPGLVVTGVVIGILVAMAAAAIPAVQAGRVSPLEALRARSSGREAWLIRHGWAPGVVLLAGAGIGLVVNPFPDDPQSRFGSMMVFALFLGGALVIPVTVSVWERIARPLMRVLFGRVGQLGSRNIQRSRLRTTLTVGALMIGVAMIVIVWVMTDSFKGDLDEWLQGYMGGDLYVTSVVPIRENVIRRIEGVPGVQAVAPVRYFEVEWRIPGTDWEKVNFMALDPATYSRVTSFVYSQGDGSSLQKLALGEHVYISSVIAEKSGLQPGDSIWLKTRGGERRFTVAAVVVDFYNQGLVIDGSWQDMERYFRLRDANTLTMNVMERTQEIGMLRSVGMTRSQVMRMILSEAALMGLIGGLMGLVFGILLSRLFLTAMTSMSGFRITYVLPAERVVMALVIALLTSQAAALLPTLRAARIRILEAVHYE